MLTLWRMHSVTLPASAAGAGNHFKSRWPSDVPVPHWNPSHCRSLISTSHPHTHGGIGGCGDHSHNSEKIGVPLCRHGVVQAAGFGSVAADYESIFEVDTNRVKYGVGALREVGYAANTMLGMKRAILFTDKNIKNFPCFKIVEESMRKQGIDVVVYDDVLVEPTDRSFERAIAFARDVKPDGFVSLGGGSVIDTCKAANLYFSCPPADPFDELLEYVNAPIGRGVAPIGATHPHIACPTTAGTGSEITPIAIFDFLKAHVKTGIATKLIRPSLAVIDPSVTDTMPSAVTACSGFDVLSHAIESYTAKSFSMRLKPETPGQRPISQGSNPYADIGCLEALRLIGRYLVRAVNDPADTEARHGMMFAATLAGISFGNAGVHLPHGMSYAVAGLVGNFCPGGYTAPSGWDAGHLQGMVPHGMAVILNAPAVFRFTASACPERHIAAAEALGADIRGATGPEDAGEVLAVRLIELMMQTGMPSGLNAVGYGQNDLDALVAGAWPQQRLLGNAPVQVTEPDLNHMFRGAMSYWS